MHIYLRRIKEYDDNGKSSWKESAFLDVDSMADSLQEKYFTGILNKPDFEKRASLYCVEKGDDVYGVFSYTIARLCVVYISNELSELIIFPNQDHEWSAEAKLKVYNIISSRIMEELCITNLFIRVDNQDVCTISQLKKAGFAEEKLSDKEHMEKYIHMFLKKDIKVLVTGVFGELGYEVFKELSLRGYNVLGSDVGDNLPDENEEIGPYVKLDITDKEQVKKVMSDFVPQAVIHCYAWSNVDEAELPENKTIVYKINVTGTVNLAAACQELNAKFMFFSSDYVFNGNGIESRDADCKDYDPLNYYGRCKMVAEQEIEKILSKFFVIRTEWTFGTRSRNFIDLLLEFAKNHSEITVVNDQIGVPTYFKDLSRLVADMIVTEKYGYYNVTNSGPYVSRNEYAKEVFRQAYMMGYERYGEKYITVESVSSEEYRLSKVIRPLNSKLDLSKLTEAGFKPLPDWKDAVRRYLLKKNF